MASLSMLLAGQERAAMAGSVTFRRTPAEIPQSLQVSYLGDRSSGSTAFLNGIPRTNTLPGTYRVSYLKPNSYVACSGPTSITVVADQNMIVDCHYFMPETGALRVNLGDAEGHGARWRIKGTADAWEKSGVITLAPGAYTVEYRTAPGWSPELPQDVEVSLYSVSSITAGYQRVSNHGYVSVTLQPATAVAAGAQWALITDSSEETWRNSGAVAPALMGANQIKFKPLENWQAPANQNVNVTVGKTTRVKESYVSNP
ncbi:MAG: hypothetical protein A2X46_18910 [Lentisphaerae bacterium GWF2_57_35]|nr:MAG: hypothetical protein A2X46_18910 [Lentisphaerae bacterium GWF2_57_35]